MPLSAIDTLTPAFEHTKQQLFRPFRFGQWTKLALVGLVAGEMATGGGSGGNPNVQVPASGGNPHPHFPGIPHIDAALIVSIVLIAFVVIAALWLIFLYLNSRMRFVLFDSVIARNCSIRRMWRARGEPAMRLFVWQIVLTLASFAGFILILGIPALLALLLGWFSQPRQHILGFVLLGIAVFFVFMAYVILALCVHIFTKDFVVPQMALEGVSAFEGWRRLLPMLRAEKGGYAGYAGLKVVLALGATFAVTVVVVILFLILLIPFGGLGVISVLLAKGAGVAFSWNVFTVTALVVAACVFLFVLFYGAALISVPVIVFFPAYSIYFFASRYQRLAEVVYPPAPPIPPADPMSPAPA